MLYKEQNPQAFMFFERVGMRIPAFSECRTKFSIGSKMGLANLTAVIFGLYSVKLVNIPMFLTFRRCSLLTTVIMNYLVNRVYPNKALSITLFLSTAGALIAGWDSLNAQWFGYILVWGNNVAQSLYNTYVSKVNAEKKVLAFEINFYFALCGFPIALLFTVASGEIWQFGELFGKQDEVQNFWFVVYLVLSASMGIMITLTLLMVCTVVGPIAINITGNVKDVALTWIGFVLFNDVTLTMMMGVGLLMSFAGSVYYAGD